MSSAILLSTPTPLRLTLKIEIDSEHADPAETVRRLMEIDCELIRVQGRERITPLHYVAGIEEFSDLLAVFLCACPASIEDLTVRDSLSLKMDESSRQVDENGMDESSESLRQAVQNGMDESLSQAAQNGNIDALYAWIRKDPNVLEKMDEIPFVDTPLHDEF
ncbi:hypothetical protein F0562_007915 [Nyssa sinensis]|uniref:Ankyrin repeat protein n=1 Tax=Nyssa sinensis TaxID=561372 RepID=A0A5J5A4F2_9ASTE|nr:hypothetical protein F0562_007915 [Nyssa sinensis]